MIVEPDSRQAQRRRFILAGGQVQRRQTTARPEPRWRCRQRTGFVEWHEAAPTSAGAEYRHPVSARATHRKPRACGTRNGPGIVQIGAQVGRAGHASDGERASAYPRTSPAQRAPADSSSIHDPGWFRLHHHATKPLPARRAHGRRGANADGC